MTEIQRVSCEITYMCYTAICSTHKTREENRKWAWYMLINRLREEGIEIPQNIEEFIDNGGEIRYYRSY